MATSTEATLRAVIVAAIQGVAQSDLDFDDVKGNVRDYPLEMHHEEDLAGYLKAKVKGEQVMRCWAVDVRAHDEPFALNQVHRRVYAIRIFGYYSKGANGESYKDMIDHARVIRGQIRLLSNNLSGTVNRIVAATPLDIAERTGLGVGKMYQGLMTYTAERNNPDY